MAIHQILSPIAERYALFLFTKGMLMYRRRYWFIVLGLWTGLFKAYGQHVSAPGEIIVCYAGHEVHRSYVGPGQLPRAGKRVTGMATFVLDFVDVPSAGQTVIQRAADIWATIIRTDFPIKVKINWLSLNDGVLGSARPASREANFAGAPKRNLWYPIALAERLARQELNAPDEYEIIINLNKEYTWYYGLDGDVAANTHDLLSVALHEIGHGLGLSDTFRSDGGSGSWGWEGWANIYDYYIENEDGLQLINTGQINNYSTELNRQLTSGSLLYASASARQANNGLFPQIYAPAEFDGGSSISHLDETTYPAGDTNALMTPQLAREEAIHVTGPLVNAILADMGYVWAFVDHDPVPDQNDWQTDVTIRGAVTSDSALVDSLAMLLYSFDGFITTDTALLALDSAKAAFSVALPAPGYRTYADFYFQVTATNGVTYRSPANPMADNYRFGFGLVTGLPNRLAANKVLALYPNPAHNWVNIRVEATTGRGMMVRLLDLHGRPVRQKQLGSLAGGRLELAGVPPGTYIIEVGNGHAPARKMLVVE